MVEPTDEDDMIIDASMVPLNHDDDGCCWDPECPECEEGEYDN